MGIKKGIDWDAVKDLGQVADSVVATRIGVTRAAVARARKMRGIVGRKTSAFLMDEKAWILSRVVKDESGCWLWSAFKNKAGYGVMDRQGKNILAHRGSWAAFRSPIPDGACVCHTCDVPACVNPDHLFLGTQADNMRDMWAKGRASRQDGRFSKREQ